MATSTTLAVETAATALVYVLSGTSEFVDVTYELAVGNVNIHVLTTLAVLGPCCSDARSRVDCCWCC